MPLAAGATDFAFADTAAIAFVAAAEYVPGVYPPTAPVRFRSPPDELPEPLLPLSDDPLVVLLLLPLLEELPELLLAVLAELPPRDSAVPATASLKVNVMSVCTHTPAPLSLVFAVVMSEIMKTAPNRSRPAMSTLLSAFFRW